MRVSLESTSTLLSTQLSLESRRPTCILSRRPVVYSLDGQFLDGQFLSRESTYTTAWPVARSLTQVLRLASASASASALSQGLNSALSQALSSGLNQGAWPLPAALCSAVHLTCRDAAAARQLTRVSGGGGRAGGARVLEADAPPWPALRPPAPQPRSLPCRFAFEPGGRGPAAGSGGGSAARRRRGAAAPAGHRPPARGSGAAARSPPSLPRYSTGPGRTLLW